jgi:predicted DNA-binding transcriptional regulator AlpA
MDTPSSDSTAIIDSLLTRREVAKILGVTPRSLDRWAGQSEGPRRFKIGRLTYYDSNDINDWLQKLKTETGRGGQL